MNSVQITKHFAKNDQTDEAIKHFVRYYKPMSSLFALLADYIYGLNEREPINTLTSEDIVCLDVLVDAMRKVITDK